MKYDVIGDIHGCFEEFVALTKAIGYVWDTNFPLHPNGRQLVFVGDLTDRGPQSIKVIEIIYTLVVTKKCAHYVPGNHCDKLYRFLKGNNVQITHGLETTVAEFEALSKEKQQIVRKSFIELYEGSPLYIQLANNKLIVAHAGIREDYIGRSDKKVRTFVLYGDITGETNPNGTPVRRDWAQAYEGSSWIVYGHTPVKSPRKINKTINIDTGAVFGGQLTAFRYPEETTVSVPSSMPFVEEKFRSFENG